jgi:hypothetical protein
MEKEIREMIQWIQNLWFKWQMRRLAYNIHACMEGAANVRELQEIGRMMREVGEKHDIASWREEGERIEANAETIVMERNVRFISLP